MKGMVGVFLTMIFIFLAIPSLSLCLKSKSKYTSVGSNHSRHVKVSNQTSFVVPLLHGEHPKVQSFFKRLKPLAMTPIRRDVDTMVFYMEFFVGTPAQLVFAILDTGSGFTWLNNPYGDPSSSYRSLSCKEDTCDEVPYGRHCSDFTNICLYKVQYADKTTSLGTVGIDKFHFYEPTETGYDPDSMLTFQMVFGTAYEGTTSNFTGVMGVGPQTFGILTALQIYEFSVCFPPSRDQESSVRFGTYAALWGETTPLVASIYHMMFRVKAIGIDDFHLTNLTRGGGFGAMFTFDTGSALTYLHPYAWDNVVDLIKKYVPVSPMTASERPHGFDLCYDAKYRRMYRELPLSLVLDGGTTLQFSFSNIWMSFAGVDCHCLAFRRSTKSLSIFGVAQMYGWNFGFNLHSMQLFVDEDDCKQP